MPVALAPSNVFNELAGLPPMTTEAKSAFVDYKSYGLSAPRPYRATPSTFPDQVITQPQSLLAELGSLQSRLEALRPKSAAAPAPEPEVASEQQAAVLKGSVPWKGATYDTFAQYAGEASRV